MENLTTLPTKFQPPFLHSDTLIENWFIGNMTQNIMSNYRLTHGDFDHLKNAADMKATRTRTLQEIRKAILSCAL